MGIVQGVGAWTLGAIQRLGRAVLFLIASLAGLPAAIARFRTVIAQLYSVGVQTLLIIVVAGLFVGMVLGLQFYYNLVDFGAESELGRRWR